MATISIPAAILPTIRDLVPYLVTLTAWMYRQDIISHLLPVSSRLRWPPCLLPLLLYLALRFSLLLPSSCVSNYCSLETWLESLVEAVLPGFFRIHDVFLEAGYEYFMPFWAFFSVLCFPPVFAVHVVRSLQQPSGQRWVYFGDGFLAKAVAPFLRQIGALAFACCDHLMMPLAVYSAGIRSAWEHTDRYTPHESKHIIDGHVYVGPIHAKFKVSNDKDKRITTSHYYYPEPLGGRHIWYSKESFYGGVSASAYWVYDGPMEQTSSSDKGKKSKK
ncbi:hypothetical protein MAA_11702 [Metarhizium robertsii ARSEF 23]|uniref:Uncharacterized protein n=1 Tax=Metarhizium robertsii (strain ARSEF 23 / ATCC MYA-3075) TaxID=655844 RepID=A0A0B2X730_METRA|nr:uncharacterized protein MAA_11702 [Metarhizium robertsii ARSEF 23]KHO10698.1 hypothetical protein MAA_11702 [Metarhizium robertsii ARSEF 23]